MSPAFHQLVLGASLLLGDAICPNPTSNPFLPNDDPVLGYHDTPSISHRMGNNSPFWSVPSAASITPTLPPSCHITFAQLLSRHGARYPTASKSAHLSAAAAKLKNVDPAALTGKYAFIADYEYGLGEADLIGMLTDFGRQQLVNSGAKFYGRYKHLAGGKEGKEELFLRAASAPRVVDSAVHFAQGFHAAKSNNLNSACNEEEKEEASGEETSGDSKNKSPYKILVISEDDNSNNTLSHGTCTTFESGTPYSTIAAEQDALWATHFTPALSQRLNHDLPGANLTGADAASLMDLCGFETVASPTASLSPFCTLFSDDEWQSYDYSWDVDQWYSYGPGNPLGPTQGTGWAVELVARLTGVPVTRAVASVNVTLDKDPETFPLDRRLYADFSHDSDITAIFAALGLDNATVARGGLDSTVRDSKGFSASRTVPFAGRAYVEKMQCGGNKGEGERKEEGEGERKEEGEGERKEEGEGEYVRVLVNDAVHPLEFCGGDEFGRCELAAFVDGLTFAKQGGHWELCVE